MNSFIPEIMESISSPELFIPSTIINFFLLEFFKLLMTFILLLNAISGQFNDYCIPDERNSDYHSHNFLVQQFTH